MFLIDFEDDSEDDMPVQKTPQNKTPKGRQSLSEKKVTFDMSGKKTPGKTPNKNNLAVGKMTPGKASNKNNSAVQGKGALQEFKGIKGKLQQKKGMWNSSSQNFKIKKANFILTKVLKTRLILRFLAVWVTSVRKRAET